MSNYPRILNANFSDRSKIIGLASAKSLICGDNEGLLNISHDAVGDLLFTDSVAGYVKANAVNNAIFQIDGDGVATNNNDVIIESLNLGSNIINYDNNDLTLTTAGNLYVNIAPAVYDLVVGVNYVDALTDGINVKMACITMIKNESHITENYNGGSDNKFSYFPSNAGSPSHVAGVYTQSGNVETGIITIDGDLIKPIPGGRSVLSNGDRVLINLNKTTPTTGGSQMNGIYVYTYNVNNTSTLTRAEDADTPNQSIFTGMYTIVVSGNFNNDFSDNNINAGYVLSTNQTANGDPFIFTKFSGFNIDIPASSTNLIMSDGAGLNNLKNSAISFDTNLTVNELNVGDSILTTNTLTTTYINGGNKIGNSSSNSVSFGTGEANTNSVSLGNTNNAENSSIAIGYLADAATGTGESNIAIGCGYTNAVNDKTITEYKALASGNYSTAIGHNSTASGDGSLVIGGYYDSDNTTSYNSTASGTNSITIGAYATSTDTNALSIGFGSYSDETNGISIFQYSNSQNSIAVGSSTLALTQNNTSSFPCSILLNDVSNNGSSANDYSFQNNICKLSNLSVPVFDINVVVSTNPITKYISLPSNTVSTLLCLKNINIINLSGSAVASFVVSGTNLFDGDNLPISYTQIITSGSLTLAQYENAKFDNLSGAYNNIKIVCTPVSGTGTFNVSINGIVIEMNDVLENRNPVVEIINNENISNKIINKNDRIIRNNRIIKNNKIIKNNETIKTKSNIIKKIKSNRINKIIKKINN